MKITSIGELDQICGTSATLTPAICPYATMPQPVLNVLVPGALVMGGTQPWSPGPVSNKKHERKAWAHCRAIHDNGSLPS